jgi:type I restriction enzyme S subunit
MTQWKEIRLGDHLSFITSGSRGWSEYYASDGALFLRIQNVGYNELRLEDIAFVQPPDGAEARRTRVQPGDVLLSITADLGRTAVVPEGLGTAHINQHLAILRVKDIDPHYLAAFLSLGPGRLQLKRLDRVGVKSGLNFDDLRSLRILLPLLPEQRRIVVILDKADTIRRKRAEAIRLADDLLKSAFLDMFGDPVTNPGYPRKTGHLVASNS